MILKAYPKKGAHEGQSSVIAIGMVALKGIRMRKVCNVRRDVHVHRQQPRSSAPISLFITP
jgi:hypothetical protein